MKIFLNKTQLPTFQDLWCCFRKAGQNLIHFLEQKKNQSIIYNVSQNFLPSNIQYIPNIIIRANADIFENIMIFCIFVVAFILKQFKNVKKHMVQAANICLANSGTTHSSGKNGCRIYEAKVNPIMAFVVGLKFENCRLRIQLKQERDQMRSIWDDCYNFQWILV